MRHGTCHFGNLPAACRYYATYGYSRTDVLRKLADREIAIGAPSAPEGHRAVYDGREGRYFIEEKGAKP